MLHGGLYRHMSDHGSWEVVVYCFYTIVYTTCT